MIAPNHPPPPTTPFPHTQALTLAATLATLVTLTLASPPTTTVVHWDFPHAPRPRLTLSPGDALTFEWSSDHGVYLIPGVKAGSTPTCEDGAGFKDAGLTLARSPARKDYGPVGGVLTWTAAAPGTYAFADPVSANCQAGMLLVVDVVGGGPAPAPSRGGAVVAAAAPAPAQALAEAPAGAVTRRGAKPPARPSPAAVRRAERAEAREAGVMG